MQLSHYVFVQRPSSKLLYTASVMLEYNVDDNDGDDDVVSVSINTSPTTTAMHTALIT